VSGRAGPPAARERSASAGAESHAASPVRTAAAYALFALAATLTNLGTQRVASAVWPWPMRDLAALAAGTGVGLVVKYLLDRRWIFAAEGRGAAQDLRAFVRYAATGILTTGIFWAIELGSLSVFRAEWARYAGGAVGLCLGYTAKYFLDRRLVFGPPRE
jgi:putative flippase GtrA